MYTVSRIKTRHAEVCRPSLTADGRKWNTRYSSNMLKDAITEVLKNKHVAPTARDVVKTLAKKRTIPKLFRTTQHGVPSTVTPW